MRNKIFFVLAFYFVSGFAISNAQSQMAINRAAENYQKALYSANLGLVESAIENLVKLKIHKPNHNYSEIAQKLEQLSEESPSSQIKYKAFVAYLYLENPDKFNWLSQEKKDNKYKMIEAMFARLDKQFSGK